MAARPPALERSERPDPTAISDHSYVFWPCDQGHHRDCPRLNPLAWTLYICRCECHGS